MILSLFIYMFIFLLSSIACHEYGKLVDGLNQGRRRGIHSRTLYIDRNIGIKIILCIIIIVPPVFISTFRGLNVGTDTANYLNIYENNKQLNLNEFLKIQGTYLHDTEVGYQQICHISYVIGGGYNLVKCICEFLVIAFVWRGSLYYHKKFGISAGICLFAFYMLEFAYSWNGVRYTIGLAIFYYAFQFVVEKKPIHYICYCFLIWLFHASMIVCILFYAVNLISNKTFRKYAKYIVAVTVIVIVVFLRPIASQLISFMMKNVARFSRYEIDTEASYGLGLYFIFALYFFPLLKWQTFTNERIEWLTILISVLAYIPLRFLGYFSPWLIRLSRIPEMLFCVLYSGTIKITENENDRRIWITFIYILIIGSYIYDAFILNKNDTYPYVFDMTNYL